MSDVFRVYEPELLGRDGYPVAWKTIDALTVGQEAYAAVTDRVATTAPFTGIKDLVREDAGHRCVRCGHPYRVGVDGIMEPASFEGTRLARELDIAPRAVDLGFELVADRDGQLDEMPAQARRQHWSACDEQCTHRGPYRYRHGATDEWFYTDEDETWIGEAGVGREVGLEVQALWRILTVHHLNGDKADCRWWNLAALCQRCHLTVQGKVQMARVWPWEHSEWFQPYVAGYYAATYLGEDLSRPEVDERLDDLLALERVA